MPVLPVILILLVVAVMFGKKAIEPGSGVPELEEKRTDFKGYGIFVAKTPEAIANPFRWRVADPNGDPVANLTGWAATEADAIAAGQAAIDKLKLPPPPPVVGPPKPTPDPPGPIEGGGIAPPPVQQCESVAIDGKFRICLYPQGNTGRYGYRAEDGSGLPVATEGGFATKQAARVAAWRMLAPMPTMIPASTRHGVHIDPQSRVTVGDLAAFKARAVPVLQQQLGKGEQDPRGLVLSIWSSIWPSINPLRVRVYDDNLATVSERVAAAMPNADAMAASIFPLNAGAWQQT